MSKVMKNDFFNQIILIHIMRLNKIQSDFLRNKKFI